MRRSDIWIERALRVRDGLTAGLRTNAKNHAEIGDFTRHFHANLTHLLPANLPFGLDVWQQRGHNKVTNFDWSDPEAALRSFGYGDWDVVIGAPLPIVAYKPRPTARSGLKALQPGHPSLAMVH